MSGPGRLHQASMAPSESSERRHIAIEHAARALGLSRASGWEAKIMVLTELFHVKQAPRKSSRVVHDVPGTERPCD